MFYLERLLKVILKTFIPITNTVFYSSQVMLFMPSEFYNNLKCGVINEYYCKVNDLVIYF